MVSLACTGAGGMHQTEKQDAFNKDIIDNEGIVTPAAFNGIHINVLIINHIHNISPPPPPLLL